MWQGAYDIDAHIKRMGDKGGKSAGRTAEEESMQQKRLLERTAGAERREVHD